MILRKFQGCFDAKSGFDSGGLAETELERLGHFESTL